MQGVGFTTNSLIKGRWTVIRKIGQGAFGEIYSGKNIINNELVAIKVEKIDTKKQVLKLEVAVLKKLQACPYVCRFITCGRHNDYNYMVMELLGDNLSELRRRQVDGKFSMTTTLKLGIQMIQSLEAVHDLGYLHRDVKPARESTGFRGTARYASINSHLSKDLGRRDDLWSIFYVLIEFAEGQLPWRKLKEKDQIGDMKVRYNTPDLVKDLPTQFTAFMKHLKSLGYDDRPNYALLQSLLSECYHSLGGNDATLFDWEVANNNTLNNNISSNDISSQIPKVTLPSPSTVEVEASRSRENDSQKVNSKPNKDSPMGNGLDSPAPQLQRRDTASASVIAASSEADNKEAKDMGMVTTTGIAGDIDITKSYNSTSVVTDMLDFQSIIPKTPMSLDHSRLVQVGLASRGAFVARRSFASGHNNNGGYQQQQSRFTWSQWRIAAAGGALAFGALALYNQQQVSHMASADDNNASKSQQTWREKIINNYHNRIREYSTPEKIFQTFASIHRNGEDFMTLDDFVRAILPHQFKSASELGTKGKKSFTLKEVPLSFRIADVDGDGLISFSEFMFFSTLLSIPDKSIRIAFQIMDVNHDNAIDVQEFSKIFRILRNQSALSKTSTASDKNILSKGWIDYLFGKNGNGKLSVEAFQSLLDQVRRDLLLLEFNMYDPKSTGFISQRDFGLLIASYSQTGRLDHYISAIETLPSTVSAKSKGISFDQFVSFNKLLSKLDDIAVSIDLYKGINQPFTKNEFKYVSKIIASFEPTPEIVDTIYTIFDVDKNGDLEKNEFVTLLGRRKYRGLDAPRDTGFVAKCKRVWSVIIGEL
eukprot:gene7731-9061_t